MARPAPGVLVSESADAGSAELAELAEAYGVAMSYEDSKSRQTAVAAHTVVDVLHALGVDASTPAAIGAALDAVRRRGASRTAVPPVRLPTPSGRTWGWMLQLYSLRGQGSWGMGDYRDLADIVRWSGSAEGGRAGLVLCNPFHAMTPVPTLEDSPYFPSSRRFRSPLYLRIEDVPEYALSDEATRARVDGLRPPTTSGLIDRDAVWSAKRAALETLWLYVRQDQLDDFRADQGAALDRFALFGVLAEEHGPDWRAWPAELRNPAGPAVAQARDLHDDRVRFHAWLQLLCDEQLATAAQAAREAGMPVGIVHDLAVGVDPGGADAWALQDVLAVGATVGCPPDSFNQLGQDWQLPPWHPTRLAEADYQPFRDMVRSVLRHAGGIRIDHVMGLFRLWWIPDGNPASEGAYVSYDWRALIGVLTQEARREGAVVIGEDLGTVETRVTDAMADAGILGCDVAWFKRDKTGRTYLPPDQWRASAIASVTTHDLPTVAGWFTDEVVRVRAELGLLDGPVEDERARTAQERAALLTMLREESLLGDSNDLAEIALALHRLLVASPAAIVVAAPGDAVGDMRQPNLPGTLDEYPNWRLPLTDGAGQPMTIEELQDDVRVRRLIGVMAGLGAPAPGQTPSSDTVTRVSDAPGDRDLR